MDEVVDGDWRFVSTIERPDGTKVTVTIVLPTDGAKVRGMAAEIAQTVANAGMRHIEMNEGEVPF
jgi:hypothetical protein